jgi:hypothetical protein
MSSTKWKKLTDDEIYKLESKYITYEVYDDDEEGIDVDIFGVTEFAKAIENTLREKNS